MPLPPPSPLGLALSQAIEKVRDTAGSRSAPIVVITPSESNGNLARQQIALSGHLIRVEFSTPERVVHALAEPKLSAHGLRSEPGGWRSTVIAELLRRLDANGALGPHAEALSQPGWAMALARATETLESARVTPEQLEGLEHSPYADRLLILAELMRGIDVQREVDRLYSSEALARAAREGISSSPWEGAVVLGDRLLAPETFETLRAWFMVFPHVEVRLPPWHNLEPAHLGLRAARGSQTSIDVERRGESTVANLARRLFGPLGEPITTDSSLTLARTPDDVRELGEATRVVLDTVRSGVPLDRIAVVLPDPRQVVVLREHFERAHLPATWLVGPPLATTPAARFLLSCLEIAAGSETVPSWYELLRLPGLRLGDALGAPITRGRGRWRRLLARCGAVTNSSTIIGAVEAWATALDEEDVHDVEGDRLAAENLIRTMRVFEASFRRFRGPATLGAHANRWLNFLRRWWRPSPDLAQVIQLLRGWGPAGMGSSLPLEVALAQLRHDLQAAATLRGSLSAPAVRVMTPMGLLGGAFDLVVVTGLSQGRFPRHPGEDPVLPDDLVDQLNTELGARLLPSSELRDFETRRFAATVGSCTGSLWLSMPATELLEARPLQPSTYLLEVMSTLLGRRASYADLAELRVRVGSRARPWPRDPARAASPLEHRVASMVTEPRKGLLRIAANPMTRRLLGLQRALDSHTPTPWTGLMSPALIDVPGLDGAPLDPAKIAKLIVSPGAYLVEEVLSIRRPARLQGRSDPLHPRFQERMMLDALGEALDAGGPTMPAFEAAWDRAMATWQEHRDDVSEATVGLLRGLARQRIAKLERLGALPRGSRKQAVGRLVPGLPWAVETELGWQTQSELALLLARKPARGQLARDATSLVLTAMVRPEVIKLRALDLDGVSEQGEALAEKALVARRLAFANQCVAHGNWWPWGERHPLRLAAEHDVGYVRGEVQPITPRRPE
ncbi:hypothetical protein [Plesiocystis pacifica]|uniref:hypothetical protein n=1 Tax=Plesiocystis pacifica TaxID=191768 RepID=UPI00030D9019|nr:hypothetical protein [Plesiocystis pacifica]